jgi:hypothetical protein
MTWMSTMSNRVTNGLASLTRLVPELGTSPTYDLPNGELTSLPAPRANRNRWERIDLASAVGRDPHETDPAIQVWPPRARPDYP